MITAQDDQTRLDEQPRLAKVLSVFDFSMMASASMGPAYSLASTMGLMVAAAGSATPMVLIVLAAFMGCIAVSYASLSKQYPNAGSSYAWILQAFGPHVGALGAWLLLMANIFAVLATAIPAGTYTLDLVRPDLATSTPWVAAVSALWVLISGALLGLGVRPTAGVTSILLIGEIVVLAASSVAAWMHPAAAAIPSGMGLHGVSVTLTGIMTAMVLAIWMVDGWELSAATSEEAHHQHGPGNGGLLALGMVTITLLIAMVSYLHAISPADFAAHSADAMSLVGQRLGGYWVPVIVITVLVSTSASLWTTMLYLTRSLFAMGRDTMITSWFSKLDKHAAPNRALLVVTIVTSLLTLLSGMSADVNSALGLAISGSGAFLGLLFVATAISALKLVRQGHNWAVGVAAPLIGAVTIGGLSLGQVLTGSMPLRIFSAVAIIVGIPFAFWRGNAVAKRALPMDIEYAGQSETIS